MFRLRKFLKNYKLQLIAGPLCKLTEAVLELMIPLITASIIDVGVRNNDTGYIFSHGGLMVLMGALGLGFALVCQKSASVASQGFGTELRNALFRHICSLTHEQLDSIGTPSLITRMTSDINQLQLAVAMLIRLVIRAPFLVIGAVVMSIMIDTGMSLIFFVATPLIGIILYFVMTRTVPWFKAVQKRLDKVSLLSRENLSGNRVIRAFNKQKQDMERFEEANDQLAAAAVRVGRISALLSPMTYIIAQAAIITIVWVGSRFVDSGSLMAGQIIALVNYMTQILLTMIVVSNLVVIFTKAAASAARVNEIFDTIPDLTDGEEAPSVDDTDIAVSFDHVSFAYGGSGCALRDISFTAKRGETIGIIGGTGSGKSTLVNLIPRFYDCQQGSVSVFGKDVRSMKTGPLRGIMGIVPQKAVLFAGTIRQNLKMRCKDADDTELEKALRTAQAWQFVNDSPEHLDRLLTAGGANLSGGQRQRLTIARALVGNPEILILDDSASALDFATDAALRRALASDTDNMTVFMVSQRVGTVRDADKILVLDRGELAGEGTHHELLKSCPVYREICLSQLREEELG